MARKKEKGDGAQARSKYPSIRGKISISLNPQQRTRLDAAARRRNTNNLSLVIREILDRHLDDYLSDREGPPERSVRLDLRGTVADATHEAATTMGLPTPALIELVLTEKLAEYIDRGRAARSTLEQKLRERPTDARREPGPEE